MGRLFFILAIFILGWLAFRYFRTQIMLREQQQKNKSNNTDTSIQEVKACAYCGTHMPEDEMLNKGKLHFCSYQHMLDFGEKNK